MRLKFEDQARDRQLLLAAYHLLKGVRVDIAMQKDDGPTNWIQERERLLALIDELFHSDIPKTWQHDAGAIARCSYCGRYSDNPMALHYDPRQQKIGDLRCDCGETHGWSGSFKSPTVDSVWSGTTTTDRLSR